MQWHQAASTLDARSRDTGKGRIVEVRLEDGTGTDGDGRAEQVLAKEVLVEVSHAIERFALAADPSEPIAVISLFQRASYFRTQEAVYREIAARAAVAVAGATEGIAGPDPGALHQALIGAADPLAREWSVTVLGPRAGATLVAEDLRTVHPEATSLERGRLFRGRWSFRREDAEREVRRLRSQLDLPADATSRIDRVLRAVAGTPEPELQDRWDAPLRYLAQRVHEVAGRTARAAARERQRALAELVRGHDGTHGDMGRVDGVHDGERTVAPGGPQTDEQWREWTSGLGTGLPVGVAAFQVTNLPEVRERLGQRADTAVRIAVSRCLQQELASTDRLARATPQSFVAVLAGCDEARLLDYSRAALARTADLEREYPFTPLQVVAGAILSQRRPLPVGWLEQQLVDGAVQPGSVAVFSD